MKRMDTDNLNQSARENVAREEILRLARNQQASLATSFEELLGDGGPADETADDMVSAIREWRDVPSTRSLE
jgi:hypothetical protein